MVVQQGHLQLERISVTYGSFDWSVIESSAKGNGWETDSRAQDTNSYRTERNWRVKRVLSMCCSEAHISCSQCRALRHVRHSPHALNTTLVVLSIRTNTRIDNGLRTAPKGMPSTLTGEQTTDLLAIIAINRRFIAFIAIFLLNESKASIDWTLNPLKLLMWCRTGVRTDPIVPLVALVITIADKWQYKCMPTNNWWWCWILEILSKAKTFMLKKDLPQCKILFTINALFFYSWILNAINKG